MTGDTIELRDVLQEMHAKLPGGAPKPFQVSFVTADRKQATGGEVITLPKVVVYGQDQPSGAKQKATNSRPEAARSRKKPAHRANRTVNLFAPGPQRYYKAHIDLLLTFNEKWIIW